MGTGRVGGGGVGTGRVGGGVWALRGWEGRGGVVQNIQRMVDIELST